MIDQYHDKTDVKIAYRNLCKIHHPDLGGSAQSFNDLTVEYERLLIDRLSNRKPPSAFSSNGIKIISKEQYESSLDRHAFKLLIEDGVTFVYIGRILIETTFVFQCDLKYYQVYTKSLPCRYVSEGRIFYFLIDK